MNKILIDKLGVVVEDKLLIEALRAVFDERIEKELPLMNDTDNNKVIGQKYRAYVEARDIVTSAFKDLNNYYKGNKTTPISNRGR